MALRILDPGSQTTVQDLGRVGLRRYGIPSSGAMDQFALQTANLLVGNPPGAAGLETLLQGLSLEALVPVVIAITGGDLGAELNGRPAPMWTSFRIQPHDRLTFKRRAAGCRAYLAFQGGIVVPELLGSRSTFARGRIGSSLRSKDTLPLGTPPLTGASFRRSLPPKLRPSRSQEHGVRVLLGPQTKSFTPAGHETFLNSTYRVSPNSDRQGYRTEGPAITFALGPDIISDPTPLGAVQVPGNGQPIILLRDGQVTGGYAKIATVIFADLDRFGQMAPGDTLFFRAVTREEALLAAAETQRLVKYLEIALRGG